MNTRTRMQCLAILAAGTVLFTAGCDQRNTTASRTADKMASATQKAGDKVDDVAITTKVKAALMAEPGLRSLEINVDTRDNVVTLNGTVDSQEKKQRAMQLAQGVEGVKSVADNLVVKSS